VPPIADATQVAALIAAGTGLVAAAVGGANLVVSIRRERPTLSVFVRRFDETAHGPSYVQVVVANNGRRPVTVMNMGLRMQSSSDPSRTWRLDDGHADPPLRATLEDGETVSMTWMLEELSEGFWRGEDSAVACFALDGRGKEVVEQLPTPLRLGA
jgi:hypothetical protein